MADREVQRRLAAILAADVAGYTRLMEEDTDGTVAAWQDAREEVIKPKVAEYSGKIVKLTGDGFLVEFPTVQDAVNCAIAIQDGLTSSSLEFRIGVNLGDIIDDGEDIHGEGVNIAARLEGLAKPGGIVLSGSVYDQVKNRIDADYVDLGLLEVKNVSDPVQAYAIAVGEKSNVAGYFGVDAKALAAVAHSGAFKIPRAAKIGIAGAVLVLAGLGWYWQSTQGSAPKVDASAAQRAALSMVVLPFLNLTSDPEQAYFADAITEDLITDLSRIQGAFVIARSTSFSYKGKKVNAKEVAKSLNVRYVLEGSVRRSGNKVRINAQLIDGSSGAHIWAEKFDRELKDVFQLQSEITGHIASVLRAELLEAESRRAKPANLEAWDYAVQGMVATHQVRLRPKAYREAKALFEKAIALDPKLGLAWEGLSYIHFSGATRAIPGVSLPNSVELALDAAQKAVSLDPKSSNAHRVLGMAYYWKGQGKNALAACQKALDLNRNNDLAIVCVSRANHIMGNLAESIRLVKKSLELNPRFSEWLKNLYIGNALFFSGKYQGSVDALSKATADFPKHATIKLYLAAALSMLGRQDEARVVLAEYNQLARGKRNTIEKLRIDRAHIVPDFERLAEALRKAGFPE